MKTCELCGLVLVGGDTAAGVINAISAKGVTVEKEVLPGIPIGRIWGGKYAGMSIVTKAGGFGDREALVKIIKYLREEANARQR
jgi:uncharacterized protein YgbK (DUF1537 family)